METTKTSKFEALRQNKTLKYVLGTILFIPLALIGVGVAFSAFDPSAHLSALEKQYSDDKVTVNKTLDHRCKVEIDIAKDKLELPAKQFDATTLSKLQDKVKGVGLECRSGFQM